MIIPRRLGSRLLLISLFCFTTSAQTEILKPDKAETLPIIASAANQRLRFTAPVARCGFNLAVRIALDFHAFSRQPLAQPCSSSSHRRL